MTQRLDGAESRSLIGVFPPEFLARRPRLFSVLSSLMNADFVGRHAGQHRHLNGAIVSEDAGAATDLIVAGVPSLLFAQGNAVGGGGPASIRLKAGTHLDHRLHQRTILEACASSLTPLESAGGTVLAAGPTGPLWRASEHPGGALHEVAAAPTELAADQRLKDRLRSGRFLRLLPVVQFLRNLAPQPLQRPALRASFILDDANLHWRSYGYIRYQSLADHAAVHGYHVDIAMVPLDGWFVDPVTASYFRPGGPLALLVHGNNHTSGELGQPSTTEAAQRVAATAWRRVGALEQRTGLRIQRVMSPPHGCVSETMMSALRRTGFDGSCYWGPTDDAPPALVGWNPADVHLGGGLPGVHRVPLDVPLDEMVLRSFLDQPLLLSGHHVDLATGLAVLSDACERVSQLGDVRWTSVSEALLGNFLSQLEGTVLRVFPFSRRLRLAPPNGVSDLVIEWPGVGASPSWKVSSMDGATGRPVSVHTGEQIALPGTGALEISQQIVDEIDPLCLPVTPWRPWPVARRFLTEGRDRMQAVFRPARPSD